MKGKENMTERLEDSFGLQLRKLLNERSLSMRKFSALTEIDTATISRIINGKRKANFQHLQKFADCLEVPLIELLEVAGYEIEQKSKKTQTAIDTSFEAIQGFLESSNLYDDDLSIERVEQELENYRQYAQTDEGKKTILKDFEEKLKRVGSIGPHITKLKELFTIFRFGKANPSELVLIGSALLYFIIPIDVIPDYIFAVGYLDDAIAVKLVINSLTNKGMVFDL